MAKQLMGMLEADFDPNAYSDEYRDRVLELVESKARGKKPKLKVVAAKERTQDLTAALAASLRVHAPRSVRAKPKAKARRSQKGRAKEKSRATA